MEQDVTKGVFQQIQDRINKRGVESVIHDLFADVQTILDQLPSLIARIKVIEEQIKGKATK